MFKFIHAADIHLDSPLVGLSQHEEAPAEAIRVATRTALTRLIDYAISEQVAFRSSQVTCTMVIGKTLDWHFIQSRNAETGICKYPRLPDLRKPRC